MLPSSSNGFGSVRRRARDSVQSYNSAFSFGSLRTVLPGYSETASIHNVWSEDSDPPAFDDTVGSITVSTSSGDSDITGPIRYHRFPVRGKQPWVFFNLHTPNFYDKVDPPKEGSSKVPLMGNDPVMGAIEIESEKAVTIQKMTVTLTGDIITGMLGEKKPTFLNHSVVVWRKGQGGPGSVGDFSGKFQGVCRIPFAFPFPSASNMQCESVGGVTPFDFNLSPTTPTSSSSMSLGSDKLSSPISPRFVSAQEIPFPPTFHERDAAVSIKYELTLRITHGRFKSDTVIQVPVKYFLSTNPPRMSRARRMAYESGSGGLIPNPIDDPGGWTKLPLAWILGCYIPPGQAFNKNVSLKASLYLATPLSYTRGSVIPCHLLLEGEDSHVLDDFATHRSPYIRLQRRIKFFKVAEDATSHLFREDSAAIGMVLVSTQDQADLKSKNGLIKHNGNIGYVEELRTECNVALWWMPPKDAPQEATRRRLDGEIHLAKDLQPSCPSDILAIEYFVELLPPLFSTFQPTPVFASPSSQKRGKITSNPDPRKDVLVSHPVEIVTSYAEGDPVPMAFTEPVRVRRRGAAGTNT